MDYYKVIDEDGLIRIEEEGGSRITVRMYGGRARLLSIYVPKRSRKKEVAGELLSMAEQECVKKGAFCIEAGFSDELWDVMPFLIAMGYEVEKGPEMISFDKKMLLGNKEIEKALRQAYPKVSFLNLKEMNADEYALMYKIIDTLGIDITWDDMCTYDTALSGVTFDEQKNPKALILSRMIDKELNIDLVAQMPGSEPGYVMAAFSNLIVSLVENAGINSVRSVVGIPTDPVVKSFIANCERLGVSADVVCQTYYAKKLLSSESVYDGARSMEDLREEMEILWHKEVQTIKYQPNIGWKVCWMNH